MIRRILNQTQNADNLLKLNKAESPCCGDTATDCEYSLTYTQSNAVSVLTITEDCVARALPCVPATTSAADVRTAIVNALATAGYEDLTDDLNSNGVTVTDNGSTLTVVIVGDVVATSITHAGGTASFTAACTPVELCTFTIAEWTGGTTGSAGTTMYINGKAYDTGTATPGTTSTGTVDTNITALLASAGVRGAVAVTVDGSNDYGVVITGTEARNTFVLGGTRLVRSACALDWV